VSVIGYDLYLPPHNSLGFNKIQDISELGMSLKANTTLQTLK